MHGPARVEGLLQCCLVALPTQAIEEVTQFVAETLDEPTVGSGLGELREVREHLLVPGEVAIAVALVRMAELVLLRLELERKRVATTAWTDWRLLSKTGDKAKLLALAAHPDGRMHTVIAGTDDQLWHNEQAASGISAAWTDWHLLLSTGDNAKALALAAHSDGRVYAAVVGT